MKETYCTLLFELIFKIVVVAACVVAPVLCFGVIVVHIATGSTIGAVVVTVATIAGVSAAIHFKIKYFS